MRRLGSSFALFAALLITAGLVTPAAAERPRTTDRTLIADSFGAIPG